MKRLLLGDVCQQVRESIRPGDAQDMPYIGLESIESGTGEFVVGGLKTPEAPLATSFLFSDEHVLYGKLRPYLNKVAVPHFSGKCSTEIIPLAPSPEVDRYYLAYFLRSAGVLNAINARVAGSRMPRADMKCLLSLPFPYLPLPEQRRIVDILSRAEGIVRLRREAEKKAAELIPALFIEMFGDPAVNPKGWPLTTLGASLQIPIRNGISPSKSGRVEGRVLTLSAITRGAFNPLAVKIAHFAALLSDGDEVKSVDFLVCRGNGNPDLVGRGCFPDADMPGVAFPDTAIAVRVSPTTFDRGFIAAVWETSFVRDQIRAEAKTTNGTYKINQTALAAIVLPKPPLDIQRRFVVKLEAIRALQTQQAAATAKAQASFDALLAQAFPA
ncbi:MAG: restriction endonuclease subunit S [Zoogloea sp.]|nr:restriction endonuclease subunit S [Zoogloea sp.]